MSRNIAIIILLVVLPILAFVIGARFSSAKCSEDWHFASVGDYKIPVIIRIDQCNRLVHWARWPMKEVTTVSFEGKTKEELVEESKTLENTTPRVSAFEGFNDND